VTPTNYQYDPGWFDRYGTNTTPGTTDMTAAINAALSVNQPCYGYGTYAANNLTQTHDFQRVYGFGETRIVKNANGVLFSSSGDNVEINGIAFRGDAASPTYTGNNVNSTGDHFRLINCGSRWTSGRAVLATGQQVQILGTCDIYQTTASGASDYDIEIGVSGTATLYHAISNIYSSQATGGVRFIDCGGHSIVGSQFGKLFVDAGTSPAGVNGGSYSSNRINGNVTVELSSSLFASNLFSAITITLVAGTSGHRLGASNGYDASCVIVDDSTESTLVDTRDASNKTYTPTWTASVNPAIGNGSLSGRYMKIGKMVFVWLNMTAGSTTTFGTGAWHFSLPFIPSTFGAQVAGGVKVLDSGTTLMTGVPVTLSDGTARVQAQIDRETAAVDSARPMTWAVNDTIELSVVYLTN
jgi:hypothetical protein